MPYNSDLGNQLVIDDSNAAQFAAPEGTPAGMSRGYIHRDYSAFPEGVFAGPMPMPAIPRSEWRDRIEHLDKTKGWPKDHKYLSGFKSLDQNGTNYCWVNAVTQAVRYARAIQGEQDVPLSPASVGGPIKNYQNVGGWGAQALQYMIDHGVAPQSMWPANAISRKYDTPEVRAERVKYKVDEWWELEPRSFDQLVTCLMHGYPVAIGLNWWSHEVLATKVAVKGNDYLVDIDNSWGTSWSEDGHGWLSESKATPDDAVVPRVVIT